MDFVWNNVLSTVLPVLGHDHNINFNKAAIKNYWMDSGNNIKTFSFQLNFQF